jgi:uncharacterized protein
VREVVEPVASDVFKVDAEGNLTLLGARLADGRVVFPAPLGESEHVLLELPREGALGSWTVQRFRPKSPPYTGAVEFTPYAVGYVDLGLLIVESRLLGDWDMLRIGMRMHLVGEIFTNMDGTQQLTFAFKPTGETE